MGWWKRAGRMGRSQENKVVILWGPGLSLNYCFGNLMRTWFCNNLSKGLCGLVVKMIVQWTGDPWEQFLLEPQIFNVLTTGKPRFNEFEGTKHFVLYGSGFVIGGPFSYQIDYGRDLKLSSLLQKFDYWSVCYTEVSLYINQYYTHLCVSV